MFDAFVKTPFPDADTECVKAYEQPKTGICHTLVIRWIKYKLLGNDKFWDTNEAKLGSAEGRQAYYEALKKDTVEAQRGEASADLAFRVLAGKQAKIESTTPKQKKLTTQFAGLEAAKEIRVYKVHNQMHIELAAAISARGSGCASYVFLSSSGSDIGHVLGAFCSAADTYFFDPNMGEVKVPNKNFAIWLDVLTTAWLRNALYRQFDTYLVRQIRGIPRDRDEMEDMEAAFDWDQHKY